MWMPTHVHVTVIRAADLLIKGKNNTNDCFVTIGLGKTKYQTSVKDKAPSSVEWREECELPIPEQGNTAEIVLTAYHRSFLQVDEFLGRVRIPLNTLDIYERPKNKWYTLNSKNKPGKESKHKERGKLEVKIAFIVKSGSLSDLSKKDKHKSSIGQLSSVAQSVGGSLLSLGSVEKRKGIKKFAKSIGSKMNLRSKKKNGEFDDGGSSIGSVGSLKSRTNLDKFKSKQTLDDADPGVVSEDEDFNFDDLSHKSSASSLSQNTSHDTYMGELKKNGGGGTPPAKPPRQETKVQDEWETKLFGNKSKTLLKPGSSESLNRRSWESSKLTLQIEEEDPADLVEVNKTEEIKDRHSPNPRKEDKEGMFSKLKHFRKDKIDFDMKIDKCNNAYERIVIGGENEMPQAPINNRISNELLQKYDGKTREDLILALSDTQHELDKQKKKLKDLEDYLDDLLLRVMETQPKILQNPYVTCKFAHKKITG